MFGKVLNTSLCKIKKAERKQLLGDKTLTKQKMSGGQGNLQTTVMRNYCSKHNCLNEKKRSEVSELSNIWLDYNPGRLLSHYDHQNH